MNSHGHMVSVAWWTCKVIVLIKPTEQDGYIQYFVFHFQQMFNEYFMCKIGSMSIHVIKKQITLLTIILTETMSLVFFFVRKGAGHIDLCIYFKHIFPPKHSNGRQWQNLFKIHKWWWSFHFCYYFHRFWKNKQQRNKKWTSCFGQRGMFAKLRI